MLTIFLSSGDTYRFLKELLLLFPAHLKSMSLSSYLTCMFHIFIEVLDKSLSKILVEEKKINVTVITVV